ncbi:MAG TPA: ABC transporter ATP-binding protein [Opitutaceae bacterium]|nr:ABC transporter ATP-binding protein [Opitutaceae bacterium]
MSTEPAVAVELADVTKDYSVGLRGVRLRALDRVNLRIAPGEVCVLLGPNGSGKSTLLKLLAGLQAPSAGCCRVEGVDAESARARGLIGYMPESPAFPVGMTVGALLRHYAELSGLDESAAQRCTAAVLETVGLLNRVAVKVGTLSKGLTQRLALAQALVHEPKVLLLDEPTAGVDPRGAEEMLALIRKLQALGRTIVLSTHQLEQAAALGGRVVLMQAGRVIFSGNWPDFAGEGESACFRTEPLSPAMRDELTTWLAARGHTLRAAGGAWPTLQARYLERLDEATGKGRSP